MLLIVGRTCVGKDTLTNALIKKGGLKMLKSYTTRPKRYESENTHIFINPALAGHIVDKVATTRINGYEYFATKDQLINNDIYIIDPYGIKTLLTHCPDISFQIIHVTAPKTLSKQKAINRSNNPDESTVFEKRYESENRQFSEFEKISETTNDIAANCKIIYRFNNDFTIESLNNAVDEILSIIERGETT